MAGRPARPPRVTLAPGLEVSRVLTGLWQVADMERDGKLLDPDAAAKALDEYADSGFDAFDMADHYGSAEIIMGRYLAGAGRGRATAFTKWCPPPGPMTRRSSGTESPQTSRCFTTGSAGRAGAAPSRRTLPVMVAVASTAWQGVAISGTTSARKPSTCIVPID